MVRDCTYEEAAGWSFGTSRRSTSSANASPVPKRFRHPDLGVLMPGNFLSEVIADSTCRLTEQMLIAALEDWTFLQRYCANLICRPQARRWRSRRRRS